jgi:hypothetical protein
MHKILIAVKCCHTRQEFAEASRQTWIKNIHGMDYKIFYGRGEHALKPDEIQLDVPDGYPDLCTKIHEMIRWAYSHSYDFLFQVDDDTYVHPDRLFASDFRNHDFVGGSSFGIDEYNRIFKYQGGVNASGPGFWLSRKSMAIVLQYPQPGHESPDEPWLGWVLRSNGTKVKEDARLGCYGNLPLEGGAYEFSHCSLPEENQIIAEWEYDPAGMVAIHQQWQDGTRRLPQMKPKEENRKLDIVVGSCHFKNPA